LPDDELKNTAGVWISPYAPEPSRRLLQSLREKALRKQARTNTARLIPRTTGTLQAQALKAHATIMHLEAGGVDESERGDGEPGLPAGGQLPAARGGEGDEQRARG